MTPQRTTLPTHQEARTSAALGVTSSLLQDTIVREARYLFRPRLPQIVPAAQLPAMILHTVQVDSAFAGGECPVEFEYFAPGAPYPERTLVGNNPLLAAVAVLVATYRSEGCTHLTVLSPEDHYWYDLICHNGVWAQRNSPRRHDFDTGESYQCEETPIMYLPEGIREAVASQLRVPMDEQFHTAFDYAVIALQQARRIF